MLSENSQYPLQLMPKIGSEEKATDWLSLVCTVSAAIRRARDRNSPGDPDLTGISAVGS